MITRIACGALHGVDAFRVDLEVDFSRAGLPAFTMVGLAEGAVRESRDRVFTALRNGNLRLPPARITVNLAPADRKKGGSSYDLPLAVGLLAASGALPLESSEGYFLAGELSLTGEVKRIAGALPLAILARDQGAKGILVPMDNVREAAVVEGVKVYGVESLGQAVAFFAGQLELTPESPPWPGADPAIPVLISRTSKARNMPNALWRSRPPAAITSCFSGLPAAARPCWPNACRQCCPP